MARPPRHPATRPTRPDRRPRYASERLEARLNQSAMIGGLAGDVWATAGTWATVNVPDTSPRPGGGTDPAPPDGDGCPPIGDPSTPIGPDGPALAG